MSSTLRRLEFGAPTTLVQLHHHLPTRSHPEYQTDEQTEHLVHLGEWLTVMLKQNILTVPLPDRLSPFTHLDIARLGEIGIHRQPPIFTARWSCVPEDDDYWSEVFPSGDNDYRWWQISPMVPKSRRYNGRLYAIELNSRFSQEKTSHRFDLNSEFYIGFLFPPELKNLKEILKR